MKQRIGLVTVILAAGALLGVSSALPLGHSPSALATHPKASPSKSQAGPAAGQPILYTAQASTILHGVIAPLNSLRLMKRTLATTDRDRPSDVPLLALLNEPIKTTGLGPIQIGMDLNEVAEIGLTPVPMEGSGQGTCQYYRIQGYSEPIGLMVVENRILRIDVWPGSLTETRSGIKIGSTEADLVRVYGNQLEAMPNSLTLGKTVIFKPKDPGEDLFRLVFETDDRGQVVQYRAGQFPSVTWPEGCL
jgi:hypothetical protein